MRFNRRHRLTGHLFAGRYKSLLVDESDPLYLRAVCDYVHLNPVRTGLIEPDKKLHSYPWSSYPSYLAGKRGRPSWLRCDRLLGEHGLQQGKRHHRIEFSRRIETSRAEAGANTDQPIRRGWLFGADDFIMRLVDRLEKEVSEHHVARERSETDEELAERIVRAGIKELGWEEEELGRRRKGDPGKIRLARELRKRTSIDLKWIARRLEMGSWSHVYKLVANSKSAKNED
jgi:putative transposase